MAAKVTKEEFASRLELMGQVFRAEPTKGLLAGYWTRLQNFDADLFDQVCNYILDEETHFPYIADFIRISWKKYGKEISGDYSTRH